MMVYIKFDFNSARQILLIIFLLIGKTIFGQQLKGSAPMANWYNLDLKNDGIFGISIDKAYNELLTKKKAKPVIIAVIDGGLDFHHEDLNGVLWRNPKEIPENGRDDDKNGYIDDVNGWNFMATGSVSYEFGNELIVQQIRRYKTKYGAKDSLQISKGDLPEYRNFILLQKELNDKTKKVNQEIENTSNLLSDLKVLQLKIGKQSLTLEDLNNFIPADESEKNICKFMISVLQKNPDFDRYIKQTREVLEEKRQSLKYKLNLNYDPRDESANTEGRYYGNGNIYGAVPPSHGTHVAGTIAAQRNNGIGTNGVADRVMLMTVRAIPDGHAKASDQANAIRYAADNGAKVINMSFGLGLDIDGDLIKDAINYAVAKDILFVCAAGNSKRDLDLSPSYPNRDSETDQSFTDVFIKVGASGFEDGDELVVPFSNYGQRNVDVFAPGLNINSTIPGNKYEAHSGTSMAAPVVSGLAAVIREYYPTLTAAQVKKIILESVVKRDALKTLCISGGVINAFEALKLAATYKN